MASTMVLTQLFAADKGARQKIVDALDSASQRSKAEEPELARHAVCLPRDEADETLVYVLIEYLSPHSERNPAQGQLIVFFNENPSLFAATTTPIVFTMHASSAFTRPSIASARDPFITLASIEYFENKRAGALEGWKKVTSETEASELETLGYGIYADRDNAALIKTLEIYESETFFRGVHMKNKAIWENRDKFGEGWRVPGSTSFAFLKVVGGFLGRGEMG